VLEIQSAELGIIGCYARSEALDSLTFDALEIRVAPDELLLIAASDERARLREIVDAKLAEADPGGLVFDISDGFSAWTLRGEARLEIFARLCAIAPVEPPASVQGLFAHIPAKVVFAQDCLHVIVASVLHQYLRERILAASADLDVREMSPTAPNLLARERVG
jgi:hypothetical protein